MIADFVNKQEVGLFCLHASGFVLCCLLILQGIMRAPGIFLGL